MNTPTKTRLTERRPRRLGPAIAIGLAALLAATLVARSATRVQFEGLEGIAPADARKMVATQITWIEKYGASAALADDAAYFLERAIRQRGYPDARVTPRRDASGGLTLSVEQGAPRRLGEITFEGNHADVPEQELKALLTRATTNRTRSGIADRSLPFVEQDIQQGIGEIENYYRSLGYLDATVSPLPKTLGKNAGPVDLNLEIKPGERYHIGEIESGGITGGDPAGEELLATLQGYSGMLASTENIAAARAEVASYFRRSGHYRSETEVVSTRHDAVVDIYFEVSKGERFSVGEVAFEGNERIATSFLERRFEHLEGKPYDTAEVDRTYREMLSTGIFETLSISPQPRDGETVDLLVRVGEAPTREFGVAAGYGSFEGGIIGLGHRQRNLFGKGRQLRSQAELTGRGLAGDITYSDPWFFESPLEFDGSLFAVRKELEGYDKFETGIRASLHWPVGEHFTTGAFAQVGVTDIYESEIDDIFLGDRTYRLSTVGISASWDTRDSPTNPRTGLLAGTTLEYASAVLGSEVDFVRATAKITKHFPIGERGELRLGARSGFIQPTENTDEIPIDLRFFNGGSTSVRGFEDRHLGPDDGRGHPVGGEFYTTFNAEYSRQIVGLLRGACFLDAGNVVSNGAGLDDMRYAAGLGLRIDLPTGPLRADYGWKLDRDQGEKAGAFHISIGLAF